MAKVYNVNSIPATGAAAIYTLLTTLIAAGWTKVADSDGTTYSSSGVQITHAGSGANGLGNASAWFVVRDPAGRREFCFQRTTTNLLWRLKFSEAARFSVGSPSATRVPQGGIMAGGSGVTDEIVFFGSGTDASPTGAQLLDNDGTYRINCLAQSTADVRGVYMFHMFSAKTGDGATQTFMACMGLDGASLLDQSPCAVNAMFDSIAIANSKWTDTNGSTTWFGWNRYGMASSVSVNQFFTTHEASGASGLADPRFAPVNASGNAPFEGADPYEGKYMLYASVKLRNALGGSNHIKGRLRDLAWSTSISRTFPDAVNITTDAWVWLKSGTGVPAGGAIAAVRWPENVFPLS